MKNVLKHISSCEQDAYCTFPQCHISKELMKHWQKCKQAECSLCMPVKSENTNKNVSNKLLVQLHSSNNLKGKLHNKQL